MPPCLDYNSVKFICEGRFIMGLQNFLNHKPLELLEILNDRLTDLAAKMHVRVLLLYILAAVTAVLIGFVGMRMAKALSMVGMGAIGYLVGVELFNWMLGNIKGLSEMPEFLSYVFGGIFTVIFFVFGWKKCLPAIFVVFGLVGYLLVISYVPDANVWLAIGGFILMAMIGSLLLKVAFIALTGAIGGFTLVSLMGAMLPDVSWLQLGTDKSALWVAVGVSVVMMIVQFSTTVHYKLTKN